MDLDEALNICGVYSVQRTEAGVTTTDFRLQGSDDPVTIKEARERCDYCNRELQNYLLSLDTVDKDYVDPNYVSIANCLTAWKTVLDEIKRADRIS